MSLNYFKKCTREACKYNAHSNVNNNDGGFCCKMCKTNGNHGLLCEKKIPRKIFVIGFNKTGTTSFHNLFLNENIKSSHTIIPVLKILNKYEAFTDGVHYNFHEYYDRYPESFYILNTRPLKKWLVSRFKHGFKKPSGPFIKMANAWQSHIQCKNKAAVWPPNNEISNCWIEEREKHFTNVLQFFDDKPNKLLIVNIERVGWENKVLEYIKSSNKAKVEAHFYKRDDAELNKDDIEQIYKTVNVSLADKGYTGEELLFKNNVFPIEKYNTYL